jgi:hypothetical protein
LLRDVEGQRAVSVRGLEPLEHLFIAEFELPGELADSRRPAEAL